MDRTHSAPTPLIPPPRLNRLVLGDGSLRRRVLGTVVAACLVQLALQGLRRLLQLVGILSSADAATPWTLATWLAFFGTVAAVGVVVGWTWPRAEALRARGERRWWHYVIDVHGWALFLGSFQFAQTPYLLWLAITAFTAVVGGAVYSVMDRLFRVAGFNTPVA